MPKKFKRKRLTAKQKAQRKRAEHAAIRRIAKEDGITQKEARKRYKDASIEVLFERPKRYVLRRFIEIKPGKFREVPKGKKLREENAEGPIRDIAYIGKIKAMKQYWELVHIMSEEYGLTLKQSRKKIKQSRVEGKSIRRLIWEESFRSP